MKRIYILVGILLSLAAINSGRAQTAPLFWVTWRAENLSPVSFSGKNLPIKNTAVDIRFELIDGGRKANLANKEVRWILDNHKVESGLGEKNLLLRVTNSAGFDHFVKIQVVDYGGETLEKIIRLPVVKPAIVLDVPYPRNLVSGSELNLIAQPYFFNAPNAGNLIWQWSANGENANGGAVKPNSIKIQLSGGVSGNNIKIESSAVNPLNPAETDSQSVNLTIE